MTETVHMLFQMPNIIFVVGGIVALVAIIAENWRKAHVANQEVSLKRDLVAQGRSPDDIERILQATSRVRNTKKEG